MKPIRTPFMPVTPDIDDDQLERLAANKGVGSLVKPSDEKDRAGEGATSPTTVAPDSNAAIKAETKAAIPPKVRRAPAPSSDPTPRDRMKSVNIELPDYVWTELNIRAAHRQTSVRHIVMTALKADGIQIAEIDLVEDGRRLRT